MKVDPYYDPFDFEIDDDPYPVWKRLRDEARYRRERLELYRARLYGGRAASQGKLRAQPRGPVLA